MMKGFVGSGGADGPEDLKKSAKSPVPVPPFSKVPIRAVVRASPAPRSSGLGRFRLRGTLPGEETCAVMCAGRVVLLEADDDAMLGGMLGTSEPRRWPFVAIGRDEVCRNETEGGIVGDMGPLPLPSAGTGVEVAARRLLIEFARALVTISRA